MKKLLILSALCLCCSFGGTLSAQRCLPGQLGVELTGGTVDGVLLRDAKSAYSYFGSLALNRYNRNLTRWVFGISYLQKDYPYKKIVVPKTQFTAEGGYFVPIFADRGRNVVFSAGLSALAGYEITNWGNKLLYDGATIRNEDHFVYGGALSAELETYLCDRVVFMVQLKERCLFGSSVGKFHTLLGIGFKVIIN